MLALVLAGALAIAFALTLIALRVRWAGFDPHHVMYLDEPWYLQAAQSLLQHGKAMLCEQGWERMECVPYPKALGWPVILAGTFTLTGPSDLAAIRTATVLGALTAPLAAVVSRGLGATRLQSLFAAAFLAVYPAHAVWSATAETNVPGAFFVLVALVGLVHVLRNGAASGVALAASALCVAPAVRPETALMFVPAVIAIVTSDALPRRRRATALAALAVALAVSVAAIVPMWRLNAAIAGDGTFLRLARVSESLRALPREVWGFHALLIAIATVVAFERRSWFTHGLLAAGVGQLVVGLAFHQFADRLLLTGTVAILPLAAFVPGTSGKREEFSDDVPTAVRLIALGLGFAGVAAIVGVALRSLSLQGRSTETQVLETRLPAIVRASVRSPKALVVTEMPAVLSHASPAPVMATRTALVGGAERLAAMARDRDVYFVCDMYCESGFGGGQGPTSCARFVRELKLEPVARTSLHARQYGIFRVLGLRPVEEPMASLGCPGQ
ncbi:MAG: glycosyltransferase family 39 protein [Deltaproteobacteria bacterium]|nr:glycosyltransferase family 39 protein [Deltaproteobacteria bacterium]